VTTSKAYHDHCHSATRAPPLCLSGADKRALSTQGHFGSCVPPQLPAELPFLQTEERGGATFRFFSYHHHGSPCLAQQVPHTAGAGPAPVHPKFGFKKHGNGIHPPICFLFKCVSKVRPINTRASLLAVGVRRNRLKLLRFLALSLFD
jgi:hypothetical protein